MSFKFWGDQLAGKDPEWPDASHPEAGYYRNRYMAPAGNGKREAAYEAVGFWQDADGNWCCARSKFGDGSKLKLDEMAELFASCCRSPVTYEVYRDFMATGVWPDMPSGEREPLAEGQPAQADAPAAADDKPPAPAYERAMAKVLEVEKACKDWLAKIGRKPATQEEADIAADFAEKFAKIEKAAEQARVAEKAPHLENGKRVDANWKPPTTKAATCKTWAKNLNVDFILAEQKKREQAAAEENARLQAAYEAQKAEAEAAAAQNAKLEAIGIETAPVEKIEAPKEVKVADVKVGTGARRQSLRTRTVYKVTAPALLLHWLADRNQWPHALLEAALAEGERLAKEGHTVPGIASEEVEGVQ